MENIKTYEELLKENEELKQRNKNQYETLTRYKNIISENINLNRKIDKAISYIKENGCFNEEYKLCTEPFNTLKLDDLLGILEGEDNE